MTDVAADGLATLNSLADVFIAGTNEAAGSEAVEIEELLRDASLPGHDYGRYRGRCKILAEAAAARDPSLTVVRGTYVCPLWGDQGHWWTTRPDGSIYDPSVRQFPTCGSAAQYVPFSGRVACTECGREISEAEAISCGSFPVCSHKCACRLVGIPYSDLKSSQTA